ncbi:LAQU0S01e14136g1_1 [Lachancea quebecensis]|uniref:Nucleolar protein 12 n=1 Tax=Lachancea quebecensis TaxID=1654605 RepID=A0A0P1KM13_9SACH|nr:LAQU0S01e14136g1_1 [Lachancea quebecensis]
MGSIDKLFGSAASKVESGLSKLFGSSAGPVDVAKVKSKIRTVLPGVKPEPAAEDEEASADQSAQEEPEAGSEEGAKPAKRGLEAVEVPKQTTKLSKRQKRKAQDADNENLESEYYSKLLEKEQQEEAGETGATEPESKDDEAEEGVKAPAASASRKDLKEEELQKAERTVFVGNVPVDVVTSKPLKKQFKKLFAVSKKHSDKPDESGDDESSEDKAAGLDSFVVESIRFRSISFEEALPRKVAFVQQKLHKSRDSANAYVVYTEKAAVKAACQALNGAVFHDHHLRVDSVAHPAQHDNKRSVFVGNLDFEEAEENLWKHFEKSGEIEYVRVVRDSKTNMGKGFAYVQFRDFQDINKALLLNDQKLNGTGRKLRVTRCKNMKKTQPSSQKHQRALTDDQRTKLGRAKKVLGKADRSTVGKDVTVEGLRATKGTSAPILKKKKQRSKSGRVTKRSTAFKKANASNPR